MGFWAQLFGAEKAAPQPRTLQEYLGIDRTGRAEMAMASRRDLALHLGDRERFWNDVTGMGEVPAANDEARGYAFVLDLVARLPGERVSEILDKMVGYGQTLRRGGH